MKKTNSYLVAAIIFFSVLLAGAYLHRLYDAVQTQKEWQRLGKIVHAQALLLSKRLSKSLDATHLLAREVRRKNGNVNNFDLLAEQLIDTYGGITNLQLAPGAIVTNIYPLAGNEKAIGHNLLQDKSRHNAAQIAIDTGLLTLAGPFELIQGGIAVIGRNPVFLKKEGKEYFWGFTSALILLEELFAASGLNALEQDNYYYKISCINPEDNTEVSFSSSGSPKGEITHSASFDVPNNTWTLTVGAEKKNDISGTIIFFSLWTCFSLLLSGSAHTLLRQPERLKKIVRKRTAELQKSEQQLRHSEEQFRGLVEFSYDWIWEVDRAGRYTYASPQVEKILGYAPEEIVGRTPFDFMPPQEAERVRAIFQESLEKTVPIVALENSALHKNGKLVILETSGVPFYDEAGEIVGYRGIDRNITERKQTEKEKEKIQDAVIESKKMWENTFDTIPLMISILNEKHEIIRVNKTMSDVFKKPIAQLLHTPCYVAIHGTDAPPDHCPHSRLLKDHKVHRVEIFNEKIKAHLAVTAAPLYNGKNQFIGSVHIAQDISKQKIQEKNLKKFNEKLQELVDEQTHEIKEGEKQLLHAEKLNAVGRFSASIAHEFNNPLQGILNVIRGVHERATLTESDRELVELAMKECNRMKELIQNLQQFNRPTSGIQKELDLHQLVDEVLLFTKKEFSSKHISVTREYAENLPMIRAVPDQIKQVLINILGNACDAIQGDGGNITISTRALGGEQVRIGIRDSGEGILSENMGDIFEPFYTTKATSGTGLGLATSYGIIKSHGGKISVESERGLGTTFTITLPVQIA